MTLRLRATWHRVAHPVTMSTSQVFKLSKQSATKTSTTSACEWSPPKTPVSSSHGITSTTSSTCSTRTLPPWATSRWPKWLCKSPSGGSRQLTHHCPTLTNSRCPKFPICILRL